MSISLPELESMSEKLRVYDVDQDGWEGDPEGSNPESVEDNLTHVIYHLVDVMDRKNFYEFDVVRDEIAPDAIQYGLRVARWGKLVLDVDMISPGTRALSGPRYFMRTSGILARQLHDEDHPSTREVALSRRDDSLKKVSNFLIECAVVQSDGGGFDLEAAFDSRLTVLRKRSNIPEPEEA